MYLNRVELIGFVGGDAMAKDLEGGKAVTNFSVATKTSWKEKDSSEYAERTEWHNVAAWGSLGKYAGNLKKGAHVRVVGELRSREYQKDGVTCKTYEIVASEIQNLRPSKKEVD